MYKLIFVLALILIGCDSSGNSATPDDGGVSDGALPDSFVEDPIIIDDHRQVCPETKTGIISGITRPIILDTVTAGDGSSTMAIWVLQPAPNLVAKTVWAQFRAGTIIAQGDYTFASGGLASTIGQLFAFKGNYYVFNNSAKTLFAFTGTSWAPVTGFTNISKVVAGSAQILGVVNVTSPTSVVLFDGTSASAPQQISTYSAGPIAPDGGNGFGVVTVQGTSGTVTLRYVTYNGTTWSAESMIGTGTVPTLGNATTGISLAYTTGLACVAGYGATSTPATAWILSGGTWTSSTLPNDGSITLYANAGTFAALTRSTLQYDAAIYKGGTWTSTQLTMPSHSGALATYGNGYVFVGNYVTTGVYARFYDGSSWGAQSNVGPYQVGSPVLYVSGANLAAVFDANVLTYQGSTWSAPFAVTSNFGYNGEIDITFEGSNLMAVYAEPGDLKARPRTTGVWGAAMSLPHSPTSGGVAGAVLARAGNGHALAVWSQHDGASTGAMFAAEFDGCTWGSPVALTGLQPLQLLVAASGSRFVVGGWYGSMKVARWTGNGITTPQTMGTSMSLKITSNGRSFVAAWAENGNIMSAMSSDGETWSAPQQVEAGPGLSLSVLTGGPAGVLLLSRTSGTMPIVNARVWNNNVWSAPAVITPAAATAFTCSGAAGKDDVLVVCNQSGGPVSQIFANDTWTPIALDPSITSLLGLRVATDGADYRVDFGPSYANSAVLHAGTWSAKITNPTLSVYPVASSSAGRDGVFSLMALMNMVPNTSNYIIKANGSVPYDQTSQMTLSPVMLTAVTAQGFIDRAGRSDAVWMGSTATLPNTPVLYAGINL